MEKNDNNSIISEGNLPLFNDLNKYFEFNPKEYFDPKIIEIYNNLTSINNVENNYTNEEIYNYITFLDLCCAEIKEYKKIVKYITSENYEYFIPLFENINIKDNLFNILDINISKLYSFFDDWLIDNFDNFYNNEFKKKDLSSYLVFNTSLKYYYIKDKIFIKNNNSREYLDVEHIISDFLVIVLNYSLESNKIMKR